MMTVRAWRYFLAVWLVFSLAASPAFTDELEKARVEKIKSAWMTWINKVGADRSQIAIARQGRIVGRFSLGIKNDTPMVLASLSKAITGACILELEARGFLKRTETLAAIQRRTKSSFTSSRDADSATINQLLTHSAGMKRDFTQGQMPFWRNFKSNRLTKTAQEATAAGNFAGKAGQYAYNNGNYAVLGSAIEAVTGKAYETVCPTVLKRHRGIGKMTLVPEWRAFSAFGGWASTASNYLAFVNDIFGPGTEIQRNRNAFPSSDMGGGARYGPGVTLRPNRRKGTNVWHFGLLCFANSDWNAGSYFAIYGETYSVTVLHDVCTTWPQMIDLDNSLVRATFN